MSYVAKGEKEYDAAGAVPGAKLHKIRITLTSSNVRNLEKCECIGHPDGGIMLIGLRYSLGRPHQPREGQAAPRQGPGPPPHQGPYDYHP